MEIRVVSKTKDLIEFIVEGERHTFPNLLRSKLLGDSAVEFASYALDHPMDNSARFVVRTKSKTPVKAIEEACKEIDSELDDFEKAIKKALK